MNREDKLCWYHGKLSREAAEQVLKNESIGTFLVRESSSSPGDFVLSVVAENEVCHYQIRRHGEDAFFSIDNQLLIHGLDALIEHYQETSFGLNIQLLSYIKRDPPPHDSRSHGRTNLLHRATKEGDLTVVSALLESDYRKNQDAKNQDGQTAIHLVCCHSSEHEKDILEVIIKRKANVNCRDKDGNTPLHYACRSKSAPFIQLLIDAKANIQARNNETGWVPIHDAARYGNLDAIKQLLKNNAPHMARTAYGELPIDFARLHEHNQVAEYLEKYIPSAPTIYETAWYHGTLSRQDAVEILMEFAKNMKEMIQNDINGNDKRNNVDSDDPDYVSEASGVFLVRYSQKENCRILTLLDNDEQAKNFIIREHTFLHKKYLYIDEGPYLSSIEHLIEHYMRFSDGLPVNLRFPVEPHPKPPVPLPSTIPKTTKPIRKSSADQPTNSLKIPKRALSIPSDKLMNDSGTSNQIDNNNQKSPQKTPKPEIKSLLAIFDTLKKNKSPKENKNKTTENQTTIPSTATPATTTPSKENNGNDDVTADHITISLSQITFNSGFDMLYNVPSKNLPLPSISNNDDEDFIQSDKHMFDNMFTENDNGVEEIYFVETAQFDYIPHEQIQTIGNLTVNENRLKRHISITSSISTESQFMKKIKENSSIKSTKNPNYYIPISSIKYNNRALGGGEFGSVHKGTLTCELSGNFTEIPVAVKKLHDEHCEDKRAEFLREASVMIKLSHDCIVRLIGISKGPPLMIVQELVELGSMLDYLKENAQNIDLTLIKIWAAQIADGMNYLQSQRFVHRDLAARNILLASLTQAKISDFGLSRALRPSDNYYQSTTGGKWPIKWYAPESFDYGTFSHASDVWSFGVTLWEMYSFGQPPYGELLGSVVIELIKKAQRLSKPDKCPDNVYRIMENCWNYEPKERPTFRYLAEFFSTDPAYQNVGVLKQTQDIP